MDKKDCYNIVLFGDSIAKGVIYDQDKGKYSVLKNSFAQLVQQRFKGIIHNAGRFGSVITKGQATLERDVLNKRPDIVVLEFGGNDCDFNWDAIAQNPGGEYTPNTTLNQFISTLQEMVQKVREEGIVPVLMTLPPLDADKYFKWISKNDEASERNILSWLGTVNRIYWWHERYNSAIMQVAQEMKVKWIDVRGAFLSTNDYRQFICEDGIHPNEQGHQLIADKLLHDMEKNYTSLLRTV
ncbi:SGNH/GDSL hydrolase family protein [Paenibacillus marinisediminis]